MKLILTTKSHLLAGSGEGQALVDADAIFDKNGFPFIPGKRIKGLLRESALEVMEMTGKSYDQLIDQVFGKRGQSAQVNFENFYLADYADVLFNMNKLDTYLFELINTETIKKRYSVEIQQTAINDLGVAAAFSLRNYRVLKKGLIFEATLSGSIPKSHQAVLYLAAINLRHIGTRRNRGFGLIDLRIEELDLDLTDALNALGVTNVNEITDAATTLNYTKQKATVHHWLQYTIKTLAPLVISKQRGDQNTVYSDSYIPASTVTGMLAEQIIAKKNDADQDAHEDDFFYDLILSADKKITDAYPLVLNDVFYPAPMAFQKRKGSLDKTLYNIFAKKPEDVTKPAQGWFKIDENGFEETEIDKTFYFHNTRQNRAEGKSLDGGIFYYDSIDKGQCFSGWIYGPASLLEHLIQLCGTEFETRMGRSRTSQYGRVQVSFKAIEPIKPDTFDDHALLMFTSPAIFYNDSGFPEASLKLLYDFLTKHFLGCATVSINKLIAATETVENYLNVWKCKTPAEAAFSKGTCFQITIADIKDKVTLNEKKNLLLHRGLGERTDEGFGHVVVLTGNAEVTRIDAGNGRHDYTEKTPVHEEIKYLLKIVFYQKSQQQIKMMAMELAEKYKPVNGQLKINNSLVGRLEAMLNEATGFSIWKNDYLGHIENQRAGKKLKEIGLWNDLASEKIPAHHETDALRDKLSAYGIETEKDAFADFTSYWKTFFRTIRKLNKFYEPNPDRSAIARH